MKKYTPFSNSSLEKLIRRILHIAIVKLRSLTFKIPITISYTCIVLPESQFVQLSENKELSDHRQTRSLSGTAPIHTLVL